MTEGIQQVFNGELSRIDATQKELLGVVRADKTGKWYKYVLYSNGSGTVEGVAAKTVVYHGDDGMDDFEVTMDITDGVILAGVLVAALQNGNYGWIQTKGPAVLAAALTAGADGDYATPVGASDGTLDVLVTGAINGSFNTLIIDVTAKKVLLDCPW